jgi:hypothetical protein
MYLHTYLHRYMGVSDSDLHEMLVHGVLSLRREFADFGTDEDRECLDYVRGPQP